MSLQVNIEPLEPKVVKEEGESPTLDSSSTTFTDEPEPTKETMDFDEAQQDDFDDFGEFDDDFTDAVDDDDFGDFDDFEPSPPPPPIAPKQPTEAELYVKTKKNKVFISMSHLFMYSYFFFTIGSSARRKTL